MKYLIAILFLVLNSNITACGKDKEDERLSVDSELQYYFDFFIDRAPTKGTLANVREIKFGPLLAGEGGRCTNEREDVGGYEYNTYKVITLRYPENFDYRFMALFSHQMGHCLYDLKHVKSKFEIMSPKRIDDESYWKENIERKIFDMFELDK